MRRNQLHSLPHLREYRTNNRQHPIVAKDLHWQALRRQQLAGKKFRRQHSVENYILDFYCPSNKLAIELDGGVHEEITANQNDQVRDERLQQLGLKVLRFRNEEVTDNLRFVLNTLSQFLK